MKIPKTLKEAVEMARKGIHSQPAEPKYHSQATWVGELRFQSKKEAETWRLLMNRYKAGMFTFRPMRQVPFHLPGKTRYVVDFLYQFVHDSTVHFLDSKGCKTETYKLKKRQVEDLYGVQIEEV